MSFKHAFVMLIVIVTTDAANILGYYPIPSISHQVVFRPVMEALANRGHQVTVVTPYTMGAENYTEIDLHDISYKIWRRTLENMSMGGQQSMVKQMKVFNEAVALIVLKQLTSNEIKSVIHRRDNYDLIFVEAIKPALVMSHFFDAPVIQISSLGTLHGISEIVGAPTHSLLYPSIFTQRLYNLTVWEKFQELYTHYELEIGFNSMYNDLSKNAFDRMGVVSLDELGDDVDLLFLNINPLWQGNQPMPPNVVYLGGLHQKPEKPLPSDLKSYLDASTQGVIYMSFGSNVVPSLLPPERIQVFVNVFSKLSYNVLWKWDKDKLPGRTDNIRIEKWLPQSDLLRHPNIKLFITQGGLQSTDEAITAGVPLIGIPMLGDQWFNVEKIVHHGVGRSLYLDTVTEEAFEEAVKTVIEDGSYRTNMIQLRTQMRDSSEDALTRAVWWTEYVLKHKGAKHYKSPAANMSNYQYFEVELLLIALAVIVIVLAIVIFASSRLMKFVSRFKKVEKIE